MHSENLWPSPETIAKYIPKSVPLEVLQDQALYLARQYNDTIECSVRTTELNNPQGIYLTFCVCPIPQANPREWYPLFCVSHEASAFPLQIRRKNDTVIRECKNEDELVQGLHALFHSQEILATLGTLLRR